MAETQQNGDPIADQQCLIAFEAAFTSEQIEQIEADYEKAWGVRRRIVLATLARSGQQLLDGMAKADAATLFDSMELINEYRGHCEAFAAMATTAHARLLAASITAYGAHGDGAIGD